MKETGSVNTRATHRAENPPPLACLAGLATLRVYQRPTSPRKRCPADSVCHWVRKKVPGGPPTPIGGGGGG